ncbi:MAG: hypothetical protein ACI84K_000851 [Pseudohongiellaceae bacterium]|jgi:hypothetical protein
MDKFIAIYVHNLFIRQEQQSVPEVTGPIILFISGAGDRFM